MAFLSREKLKKIGLGHLGKDVLISEQANFYNNGKIHIDDYTRIDEFCILSAGENGIYIGRNVHISAFCTMIGRGKIFIDDYAGLSTRVSVYSANDDYSGQSLTNSTVDLKFKNIQWKDIFIGKHAIVGTGSVLLPGTTLEDGVAIGALSLVKSRCKSFGIYAGIPAKFVKERSKKLLDKEKEFLKWLEKR